MRILLCDVPVSMEKKFGSFKRAGSTFPPYNLLLLGTILRRQGHTVQVTTDDYHLDDVAEVIRAFEPGLIGLTYMTLGEPYVAAFCDMVERECPKVPLVVGGYHCSLYPEQTLRSFPRVLAVFKGEAEKSLPQFLELCGSGTPGASELKDVKGIAYRDGEVITDSGPAERIEDLDDLPFPEYDLIPGYFNNFRAAANRHYFKSPQAFFLTGRGCPYDCHFCGRMMLGRTVRQNSIEYNIEHIRFVRKHYGVQSIVYADEFLTQNRKNMYHFSEELQRNDLHKVHWACSGRINNMDVEFARVLRQGGCRQIGYGLESGSQKILDLLNKKASIEKMSAAVRAAHEGGLEVFGNFMIGCPGETRETIEMTRRFILDNPIGFIVICFFTPMPGTFYWDQGTYKEYGALVSEDFSIFNTFAGIPFVPHGLTADDLQQARNQIYRDFYLRPKRLLREARHLGNPSSWAFAARLAAGLAADLPVNGLKRLFPTY